MNTPGTAQHRYDVDDGAPFNLAKVRRWLRGLLPDVLAEAVDDASLVLTELVTNAMAHARGVVAIRASRPDAGRILRLEIDDRTWRLGPRPAADPGRRGGRGLLLVENLCLRWGVLPGLRGKTIWAELATPA